MPRSVSRFTALVCALVAIFAGTALAAENAVVETFLASDGSGELLAIENSGEGKGWTWQACVVDLSRCTPYAEGSKATTDSAAPETIFRATSRAGRSASSPIWHGDVKSLTAPSVRGPLFANQLVTPVPSQWGGGWDGDYDWTQLAACTNESGGDCVTLTDQHFNGSCAHGAAVLDPAFVGKYLRVADQRVEREAGIEFYAVLSPYHHGEVWQPGALTSVAIVGRIQPARGGRKTKCGPPPIVAKASISRDGVATIQCTLGCRATLVAKQGTRVVRVRGRALPSFSKKLQLSRQKIGYFGKGAVQFSVLLDGKQAIKQTVRDL
jgi:hypothetical protein